MLVALPSDLALEARETGLARSRGKKHRDKGDEWAAHSPPSDERHIAGASAEFLIAWIFGVEPNRKIYGGGDGQKPDLLLPSGRTCEVKSSGFQGAGFGLRSANYDDFSADLGVMVYTLPHSEREFIVAGWTTRARFNRLAYVRNWPQKYGGPKLELKANFFDPFALLLEQEGEHLPEKDAQPLWNRIFQERRRQGIRAIPSGE